MTLSDPEVAISCLPRADGSARYSHGGYLVTASVNGPIEAARRDEHPYDAHVDVTVRPAAGVGATRERHLEALLQSSLSEIILVQNFPRSLIQVVLQIEATPENFHVNTKLSQPHVNIAIIPALLQTAVLALLSAEVPMSGTATSCLVAVVSEAGKSKVVTNPDARVADQAVSLHALAFTSQDGLLLAESEGEFSLIEFEAVCAAAKTICCRPDGPTGNRMAVDDEDASGPDMRHFVRSTMEAKTAADLHWK